MAYIKKIRFTSVDTNSGCTCDRCGQYIKNIWNVTYTSGETLHYGIDCFEKISKKSLTAYGMKLMREALKGIQYYEEELKKWKDGGYTEESPCWVNEHSDKESYWYDKDFAEYRDWHINEVLPYRIEEKQKVLWRFRKINFEK